MAIYGLLAAFALVTLWFGWRWFAIERGRRAENAAIPSRKLRPIDLLTGFVTNFFDTLGIGSFAPTTAIFKLQRRMPDEDIPGTLNTGHTPPTVTQALIFVSIVTVDVVTLVSMIAASVAGAWLGVGIVSRLPRRAIQIGMGIALLVAASLLPHRQSALDARRWRGARIDRRPADFRDRGELPARLADDAGHRLVRAVPDSDQPARHESAGRVSHHDGLVRPAHAGRRRPLRARRSLQPRRRTGTGAGRHSCRADRRIPGEIAADRMAPMAGGARRAVRGFADADVGTTCLAGGAAQLRNSAHSGTRLADRRAIREAT